MGKPLTYERIRKVWFRAMNRADSLRTKHAAAERKLQGYGTLPVPQDVKREEATLRRLAASHLQFSMYAWSVQRALRPPPPEKFKRGKRKVA